MKSASEWPVARLGDVVTDMQPGFAQAPGKEGTGIGQIRTNNISPEGKLSLADLKYVSPSQKDAEKYLLQKGDVIFNNTNSEEWVGKTALYDIDESLLFSNHMTRVRANSEYLFPEYLALYLHFLWTIGFSKSRAKRWVSQAAVDQRELATYKVPLPPLPEQQRVVEILKQADALCRQRREVLDSVEGLERAVYLDMFPETLSGKINRKTIQEVAKYSEGAFRTGPFGSQLKHEEFTEQGVPVLGIDNVVTNRFIWPKQPRCLPEEKYAKFRRFRVYPGDLIFTIMGTAGRVAVAPDNLQECMSTKHLCVVSLNEKVIRPWFAWAAVRFDPLVAKKVQVVGHGAVMTGWNMGVVKKLSIPVPPIHKQEEYEQRLLELEDIVSVGERIGTDYEALTRSLQGLAFQGELTQAWREAHQVELEIWRRDRPERVPGKSVRVSVKETASPGQELYVRPARNWLMNQLSETQSAVHRALGEWKGTLIPFEDLDNFLAERPFEHLEDAHDQVRRALNQLASLGLVARVSMPTNTGEYVTGYRVLREDELSKDDDLERLGATA